MKVNKIFNALDEIKKEIMEASKNDYEETIYVLQTITGSYVMDEICETPYFSDVKRFNDLEDVSRFKGHYEKFKDAETRKVKVTYNFA